MARRSKISQPEKLRLELLHLIEGFELKLNEADLREQVLDLVPANYLLRDLGSSLITDKTATSASKRILSYLRKYPKTLIQGDELMVVAGISEYARRIRELRVQMGWPIYSGNSLLTMVKDGTEHEGEIDLDLLKPDVYYLAENQQDRQAAFRWNMANEIRKSDLSVKDKILKYFRQNVGNVVTGEELQYLAKDRSEWARRSRELRTEEGWPVMTRNSGRPDLPVGAYLLVEDRQAPAHDRTIPDPTRVKVLERDAFSCRICHWNHDNANIGDRLRCLLELHHIQHHIAEGESTVSNLITLCNICHDDVHRGNVSAEELLELIRPI